MQLRLCNLLPFCPTYYFSDGSVMRRSSRESLTYEGIEKTVHVDFYFDPPNGFLYYAPQDVRNGEREELIRKLETYCKRKRYKARLGS